MTAKIEDVKPEEIWLNRSWLALLVRGIILAAAGVVLLISPGAGMAFVAFIGGLFLLVDGAEKIYATLKFGEGLDRRVWIISLGKALLEILLGLIIMANAQAVGTFWVRFMVFLVGFILAAFSLWELIKDPAIKGDFYAASSSVLMVILGVLLMVVPFAFATLFMRILGVLAIAGGGMNVYWAFRLRRVVIPSGTDEEEEE